MGEMQAALKVRKQLQRLPSIDPEACDFRRLRYCRYADDFALTFTGPKREAEEIKRQSGTFLREELKRNLSEEKPLITHARSEAVRFLGYAHHHAPIGYQAQSDESGLQTPKYQWASRITYPTSRAERETEPLPVKGQAKASG
jgi:hypothetical protein